MDENQQTVPPAQYPDGSRVLCADGQPLGEVVATYREHLIVERGYFFPTNFYVPYAAIAEAGGGDIVLALTGHDALSQGWHIPPADPVVPEAPAPAPPPAKPVATSTTAAPVVPAEVAPIEEPVAAERDTATPEPVPAEATTAAPAVVATDVPEVAPEPEAAQAIMEATTTTAAPAAPVVETAAVEAAVEVQSFQPDATVPPPEEPEDAGTVSLSPSFVGIPGRRLTDSELWSLLEPKDTPAEPDEETEDTKDAPGKPDS
jgi:hypothetical protein